LRENEIRKDKGVFKMLNNQEKKNSFIGKLSDVVNQQKFEVISATTCGVTLFVHHYHFKIGFHALEITLRTYSAKFKL
jgi:hypothetical protein